MTTIAQVRDAIKGAVETTGLSAVAYLVDTINPPVAHVFPTDYDPRMVFSSAKATYPFTVRVFMHRFVPTPQQQQLDALKEPTGSGSLTEAVQDSDNWGSVDVDYAQVVSVGGNVEREIAGTVYLTADFDIEVVW
jgi:hypothetical protein